MKVLYTIKKHYRPINQFAKHVQCHVTIRVLSRIQFQGCNPKQDSSAALSEQNSFPKIVVHFCE